MEPSLQGNGLEEDLLEVSGTVMDKELSGVSMDIERVRKVVYDMFFAWAREILSKDPGSSYAVRGYVRQRLSLFERNLRQWFSLAEEEVQEEKEKRDQNIHTFCSKHPSHES